MLLRRKLARLLPQSDQTSEEATISVADTSILQNAIPSNVECVLFCSSFSPIESSLRCIMAGLSFTQHGNFVNTARIDPELLYPDTTKSYYATEGAKEPPIFIMLGCVVASYLAADCMDFNRMATHGLALAPFAQEIRRDISVWGQILGFRTATGTIDKTTGGLVFMTRPIGWGSNNKSERESAFFLTSLKYFLAEPDITGPQSPSSGSLFPSHRLYDQPSKIARAGLC